MINILHLLFLLLHFFCVSVVCGFLFVCFRKGEGGL